MEYANAKDVLAALRRRIDAIDDRLHDLLLERARVVEEVGRVKRQGDGSYFRPGREAQVLRRLIARHSGSFPRPALVRIWREIMSGATAMQDQLNVAVSQDCWDLARDHFGSVTPLLPLPDAAETILAIIEGRAALGVLPVAGDEMAAPWWLDLVAAAEPKPRVVARLPFGAIGNAAGTVADAFVVAAMEPEASGDDCTLIAVVADSGGTDLTAAFRDANFDATPLARVATAKGAAHLVEVGHALAPQDRRLGSVHDRLGPGVRLTWLGLYARPLPDAAVGAVAPV